MNTLVRRLEGYVLYCTVLYLQEVAIVALRVDRWASGVVSRGLTSGEALVAAFPEHPRTAAGTEYKYMAMIGWRIRIRMQTTAKRYTLSETTVAQPRENESKIESELRCLGIYCEGGEGNARAQAPAPALFQESRRGN